MSKRAPIPKNIQVELARFASAAYYYLMEHDHPIKDGIMIGLELDKFRQAHHELSTEARLYVKGFTT